MKKIFSIMIMLLIVLGVNAQTSERHELTNSSVSINAVDFRNSRNIEKIKDGSREFIIGKEKVYSKGEPSKLVMPYAEYGIKSKMAGGKFKVTITYKIDKSELKNNKKASRFVRLALDEHSPIDIELKESSSGYLKASGEFNLKFLRGKNHVVKVWLPSKGVMIDKIDIRRKLL